MIRTKEIIYYSFKNKSYNYQKYILGKVINFYDPKGRLIKMLDYYRWNKKLELSAVRLYFYDKRDRLIYEEVRQVKAGEVEKKYSVYDDKGKELRSISLCFEKSKNFRLKRFSYVDYFYDKRGRLERDVMIICPNNFSQTKYFYNRTGKNLTKKIEILQLGKGNRWQTTYYYDKRGRIIKQISWCKKGPYKTRTFKKYFYDGPKTICMFSNGEKEVTIKYKDYEINKSYDGDGVLQKLVIFRDNIHNNSFARENWSYSCDCRGVIAEPIQASVVKYYYK